MRPEGDWEITTAHRMSGYNYRVDGQEWTATATRWPDPSVVIEAYASTELGAVVGLTGHLLRELYDADDD